MGRRTGLRSKSGEHQFTVLLNKNGKGWCQCLVGSNPNGVSARKKLDEIANT